MRSGVNLSFVLSILILSIVLNSKFTLRIVCHTDTAQAIQNTDQSSLASEFTIFLFDRHSGLEEEKSKVVDNAFRDDICRKEFKISFRYGNNEAFSTTIQPFVVYLESGLAYNHYDMRFTSIEFSENQRANVFRDNGVVTIPLQVTQPFSNTSEVTAYWNATPEEKAPQNLLHV